MTATLRDFLGRLAANVKKLRESRKWSMATLAEKAGTTANSIFDIEHEKRNDITLSMLVGLAKAFEVNTFDLTGEISEEDQIALGWFRRLDELQQAFYLHRWTNDPERQKVLEALMEKMSLGPGPKIEPASELDARKKPQD